MNKEGDGEDELNRSSTIILNIDETEMIRLDVICRLCANQSDRIIGIFSEEGTTHELAVKMNTYLPIKVNQDDTLPLQCCWNCASTVLAWHELVVGSVEADRRLKELQIIASKAIAEVIDVEQPKIEPTPDFEKDANYKSEDEWETEYFIIEDNEPAEEEISESVNYYEDDKNTKITEEITSQHSSGELRNRRRRSDIMYDIFCDVCHKGYTRRSDMERHRKLKHKRISKNYRKEDTPTDSVGAVNKAVDFSCRYCGEKFKSRIELKVHMKAEHGMSRLRRKYSEIKAEYFCDICEKGFTRKYDMKKHREGKHPNAGSGEETEKNEKLRKLRVSGPDNRIYYRCDVCKKVCKYPYDMLRHQAIHTKVYIFVCHICAKRFPSSSGLRRHVNQHHYGVKKFSCEICGKSFAANATREEHMNIHTNNRPFVCDICGKAFKQKASLRSHKLFHTNDFKFACSFCNKKFRRAYELKTHTWTHTGHRPHQCHLCSSTFRLGQDLKRHLRVHDKLGECTCDECGATFSQQKYLNNHKRSHKAQSKANNLFQSNIVTNISQACAEIDKVLTVFQTA